MAQPPAAPAGPAVQPTTPAALGALEGLVIKPDVMRGYFGNAIAPKLARELLRQEWRSCHGDAGVHLCATVKRRGRDEVAGAGLLRDGELRFFVAPDLRRQGVGRALLAALQDAARERGLAEVTAWVFPENHPSARLLTAAGFVARSSMNVTPHERAVPRPALQFRRSLGPGGGSVFGRG